MNSKSTKKPTAWQRIEIALMSALDESVIAGDYPRFELVCRMQDQIRRIRHRRYAGLPDDPSDGS